MNKAEYKFNKNASGQIQRDSKQSEGPLWYWKDPANSPIYIPKRKKKK